MKIISLTSYESDYYKNILFQVETAVTQSLNQEPQIAFNFCNALDPLESGCAETEFIDNMHMLKACSKKVLRNCLTQLEGNLLP